jgi:hypothetical protein
MTLPQNEVVVRELWRRMSELRFRELAPLLADDLICEWPLTRERIRGRENYIEVNEAIRVNGGSPSRS